MFLSRFLLWTIGALSMSFEKSCRMNVIIAPPHLTKGGRNKPSSPACHLPLVKFPHGMLIFWSVLAQTFVKDLMVSYMCATV